MLKELKFLLLIVVCLLLMLLYNAEGALVLTLYCCVLCC